MRLYPVAGNGAGIGRSAALRAAAALLLAGCTAGEAELPRLAGLREIPSPAGPGAAEPNLTADAAGRVYLSWLEPEDTAAAAAAAASTRRGAFALRLAVLQKGAWSAVRTIARGENFFVNWADFPSVVPLPDGSLAAHWLARSGTGTYAYDVHIARSTDGGASWGPALIPHRDGTASEHGFVSLFPWDGRGTLGAVWLDGRNFAASGASRAHSPEMTLRFTSMGPAGELGEEMLLDGRTCDCCQTAAALTADGPIVVYRGRSGQEVRDVWFTRFTNGAWSPPRLVHDDGWVIPACPVNGPAVSAAGRRVAVAWFTSAGERARVKVAFSADAGASFGKPVRVDSGEPAGRVDIELLGDGAALVSWLERGKTGAEVRVRRVSAGGRPGRTATIAASSAERASGFPRMARTGNQVVFAWTEPGRPAHVRVATARIADL